MPERLPQPLEEGRPEPGAAAAAIPLRAAVHHAAGLAELAGHVGAEIATLVQEVHAASSPLARLGVDAVGRGVYGSVRLGFRGARRAAALGSRALARAPGGEAGLDLQSALNGAFGHLYEEAGSGYALPMRLLRPRPSREAAPRLLVFAHGLCMNERGWERPEHRRFRDWASHRLDADVAYLRYNTGLRISSNGARLAELLERESHEPELLLVGHSMGGLVLRSALRQGQDAGHGWPARVHRLVCLGSPHEGSHLERLGHRANRLLGGLPWTRPFMRLGDLRSDGIRDLRFGHLLESDWDPPVDDGPRRHAGVEPAEHVAHLYVAAALRAQGPPDPLGDWLVPVASALAERLHAGHPVERRLLRGLHHFDLLGDARVYELLRRFLEA